MKSDLFSFPSCHLNSKNRNIFACFCFPCVTNAFKILLLSHEQIVNLFQYVELVHTYHILRICKDIIKLLFLGVSCGLKHLYIPEEEYKREWAQFESQTQGWSNPPCRILLKTKKLKRQKGGITPHTSQSHIQAESDFSGLESSDPETWINLLPRWWARELLTTMWGHWFWVCQ